MNSETENDPQTNAVLPESFDQKGSFIPDIIRALRNTPFRIFWIGAFFSFLGSWIQTVAQGSLVYDLTGDQRMLGLVGFLGSIPMFVYGPFAGYVVDYVNKKTLLIISQSIYALIALTIGALALVGWIQPWHVLLGAFINGLVFPFDAPARHSMVSILVPREDLANGIALNSGAFNLARMIGPAIGGLMLNYIGPGWCYLANGFSFGSIILAIALIQITQFPREQKKESLWRNLTEGMRFIANTPALRVTIMLVMVNSLFIFSYMPLMPSIQTDILRVDKSQLGMLFSSVGVGSVLGLTYLAAASRSKRKGLTVVISAVILSIIMIFLASLLGVSGYMKGDTRQVWGGIVSGSHILPLLKYDLLFAKILLGGIGFFSIIQMSLSNTLIQTYTPEHLRGRSLAVHIWSMAGFMPFGALLAGFLAKRYGTPNTLLADAIIAFCISVTALILAKSARELE